MLATVAFERLQLETGSEKFDKLEREHHPLLQVSISHHVGRQNKVRILEIAVPLPPSNCLT